MQIKQTRHVLYAYMHALPLYDRACFSPTEWPCLLRGIDVCHMECSCVRSWSRNPGLCSGHLQKKEVDPSDLSFLLPKQGPILLRSYLTYVLANLFLSTFGDGNSVDTPSIYSVISLSLPLKVFPEA